MLQISIINFTLGDVHIVHTLLQPEQTGKKCSMLIGSKITKYHILVSLSSAPTSALAGAKEAIIFM